MLYTSAERYVHGAVHGVGFMLTNAVLCLQSQFEDYTFRITKITRYCHCVPFDKKLASITNYREKQSFPWPLVMVYFSWEWHEKYF